MSRHGDGSVSSKFVWPRMTEICTTQPVYRIPEVAAPSFVGEGGGEGYYFSIPFMVRTIFVRRLDAQQRKWGGGGESGQHPETPKPLN